MSREINNTSPIILKTRIVTKKHKVECRKYAYITSINYVFIQILIDYDYGFNSASNDLYMARGMKKALAVKSIKKWKLKTTKRLMLIGF